MKYKGKYVKGHVSIIKGRDRLRDGAWRYCATAFYNGKRHTKTSYDEQVCIDFLLELKARHIKEYIRKCIHCGATFEIRDCHQTLCSAECKKMHTKQRKQKTDEIRRCSTKVNL